LLKRRCAESPDASGTIERYGILPGSCIVWANGADDVVDVVVSMRYLDDEHRWELYIFGGKGYLYELSLGNLVSAIENVGGTKVMTPDGEVHFTSSLV
jgi:hypothetical protein